MDKPCMTMYIEDSYGIASKQLASTGDIHLAKVYS